MKAYGASRVTLPVELNARELSDAGVRGELIVYGYLPMMVSAQCVKKRPWKAAPGGRRSYI